MQTMHFTNPIQILAPTRPVSPRFHYSSNQSSLKVHKTLLLRLAPLVLLIVVYLIFSFVFKHFSTSDHQVVRWGLVMEQTQEVKAYVKRPNFFKADYDL